MSRLLAALLLTVLLAACGGGGGDEEPTQPEQVPGTIGARGGVQASVNGLGLQK